MKILLHLFLVLPASFVLGSPDHWAFQPVAEPPLPNLEDPWIANPIDAFVLAKLRYHGLAPSKQAPPHTLIRRAALSLTGLPPSPSEISSHFDQVLDQFLASPRYGEHWARHWLDVARYSDAKGYVDAGEVQYPFAYTYRDYVVQAFNRDLPFDRFVREQLAADRLDRAPDDPSLAALGFLTVGSRFNFFPHEIIDDRIDAVGRGFLGLSIACARCHDHKFDPISTADYYGLYSIFANSIEPHPGLAPRLDNPGPGEDAAFHEALCQATHEYETWQIEKHAQIQLEMVGWAGDYLRYLVQSMPEHRTEPQPTLQTERGRVREISAYAGGGVRHWKRFLETRPPEDPIFGLWVRLVAFSREEIPNQFSAVVRSWSQSVEPNGLILSALEDTDVQSMADVAELYTRVIEKVDAHWRTLKNRQALVRDAAAIQHAMYHDGGPGDFSFEDADDYHTLDESVEYRQRFANVERAFLADGLAPRPMLVQDRPAPIQHHVFIRGDAHQPGSPVQRSVPKLFERLSRPITDGSGRAELAEMITHPDNPLTARVIVNRVWAWHFGQGLVETPSNFGLEGSTPSHPELLDYLAWWFRQNGQSLKKLHRLILTSSTWQQGSRDRPDARSIDPENRLLWKMNRRRMSFESMRDSLLHVAGNLDQRHGGRPIRKSPDDPEHHRRTLYTYLDREKLPEVYRVFDFPSPDITAPGRTATTVPQQSLFLLNNPFILAQGKSLVAGLDEKASVRARIHTLYLKIYLRPPSESETMSASAFLADTRWNELAQALLLSNEFLFID